MKKSDELTSVGESNAFINDERFGLEWSRVVSRLVLDYLNIHLYARLSDCMGVCRREFACMFAYMLYMKSCSPTHINIHRYWYFEVLLSSSSASWKAPKSDLPFSAAADPAKQLRIDRELRAATARGFILMWRRSSDVKVAWFSACAIYVNLRIVMKRTHINKQPYQSTKFRFLLNVIKKNKKEKKNFFFSFPHTGPNHICELGRLAMSEVAGNVKNVTFDSEQKGTLALMTCLWPWPWTAGKSASYCGAVRWRPRYIAGLIFR